MTADARLESFLADLNTITAIAKAGVLSTREERIRPGETRPAAALFIDVVGFTELSRALGREHIATLIDRTFRIFELTAQANGGYCDKVIGDAALYVFAGHPNHPPVCESALRAGLKLVERVNLVNESLTETGVKIAIRCGVAFGDVARQVVGSETAQITVMGDTVNAAQRLESNSQPGTVLTTVRVIESAGDMVKYSPAEFLELKGMGKTAVFRVEGFRESDAQLRGAYAQKTPMVGRDAELDGITAKVASWLETRYAPETLDWIKPEAKIKARNRLVVIRGVAAIGKSRLAYEVAQKLKSEMGASVATGHLTEHASVKEFTAELARVAGLTADNLTERWEELCANAATAVSDEYAERMRGHLWFLAYVLDCPHIDASAMRYADAASFALNARLAIRACVELAGCGTVVLIIEDVQWIGNLREIVHDVIENACLPFPLIVIATARPEYEHVDCALGEGDSYIVNLDALNRDYGNAIIAAMLPGLTLPPNIENELHEKAVGIPYFYEEFCRMMVRHGIVISSMVGAGPRACPTSENGQPQGVAPTYVFASDVASLDIPDNLKTLMLGRLDMLEPDLKAIAQRASVLGRSFEKRLLTEIEKRLGLDHDGHPDDELDALLATRLLLTDDGDNYFYEHLLLREAAYSSLLMYNRKLLHSIAADVLKSLLVPGTLDEWTIRPALIKHLEGAERHKEAHAEACELLILMASTGRYDDWDTYYARAVKLRESDMGVRNASFSIPSETQVSDRADDSKDGKLPSRKEGATRVAHSQVLPKSASFLNAVGARHYRQGRMDEARAMYEESLAIRRELGDRRGEATSLNNLGNLHMYQGRMDEARAMYEESLAIKREIGDRRGEAYSLNNLGNIHWFQGRMDEARVMYEQSLPIFRQTGNRYGEAISLNNLGNLHRNQGRMEEARAMYEESLAIRRELGNRRGEARSLNNLGCLHHHQGRMDEARAMYEESLAIFRELGDRHCEATSLNDLGAIHRDQGRIDDARTMFEESLAIRRELGDRYGEANTLTNIAELQIETGELQNARETLARLMEIVHELHDINTEAYGHCRHVAYWIAVARVKIQRDTTLRDVNSDTAVPSREIRTRHASEMRVTTDDPEPDATIADCIENARASLAEAEKLAMELGTGAESGLGQLLEKSRKALADFEAEHGERAKSK
jgi:class 3 adenylate cyclase/tetratricopeptide (TPR) repeat protein